MSEPSAEDITPAPVAKPARRGGLGFFIAGAGSAVAGFALALYLFPYGLRSLPDWSDKIAAQEARLTALEAKTADLAPLPPDLQSFPAALADLNALTERVTALEAVAVHIEPLPPDMAGLPEAWDKLGQLEAKVAALQIAPNPSLATAAPVQGEPVPEGESAGLAGGLQIAPNPSLATAAPVQGETPPETGDAAPALEDLARRVAALEALTTGASEDFLAPYRRALAEAEAASGAASDAARRAAALAALAPALANGAPFAQAAEAAGKAGIALPPELAAFAQGGLPSLAALQADFPQAARAALRDSLAVAPGAGWGERSLSFLRRLTGARSTEARPGDDPDAVLSRAEAALAAGDLPGALAELDALPPAGAAALADWRAGAEARLAGEAALSALLAESPAP